MNWRKLVLLGLSVLIVPLFGCREVHHYGYKLVELNLLGGQFVMDIVGRYGDEYKKEGKESLDWGSPYSMHFEYTVSPNEDLSKLIIRNIVLVGEKTKTVHKLSDIQGKKVRVYGERKLIRISAGPLTSQEYEYQNYRLTAIVIVEKNGTTVEEKVSILLETEYRKERRSDWFDEKMSV